MNKNLFDKIRETAKEMIRNVHRFGDGKKIKEYAEKKYQGEIAGEQEFPGELTDVQNELLR